MDVIVVHGHYGLIGLQYVMEKSIAQMVKMNNDVIN
jgi:hypothetical protein